MREGTTDDERVSVQIGCITSTPLNLNSHHHHNWVEEAKKTTCSNATATTTTEGFQLLLLLLEVAKSYLVLNLLFYKINPLLEELILVAIVYNLSDTFRNKDLFLLAWDFLRKLVLVEIFKICIGRRMTNFLSKRHFWIMAYLSLFARLASQKNNLLIKDVHIHFHMFFPRILQPYFLNTWPQ